VLDASEVAFQRALMLDSRLQTLCGFHFPQFGAFSEPQNSIALQLRAISEVAEDFLERYFACVHGRDVACNVANH